MDLGQTKAKAMAKTKAKTMHWKPKPKPKAKPSPRESTENRKQTQPQYTKHTEQTNETMGMKTKMWVCCTGKYPAEKSKVFFKAFLRRFQSQLEGKLLIYRVYHLLTKFHTSSSSLLKVLLSEGRFNIFKQIYI